MRHHFVALKPALVCLCLALLASGAPSARTGAVMFDPDDGSWDTQFGTHGANGPVFAVAVSGTDVFVGGRFTRIGGVRANSIARFDTSSSTWSALGGVTTGGGVLPADSVGTATVTAIAVDGANVFVGGDFISADGTAANRIARWNGAAWSALANGVTDADLAGGTFTPVTAIAAGGGNVYVGGNFTTINNTAVAASHIARWNGAAWSALGSGLTNIEAGAAPVTDIALDGSLDLYVTGAFQTAGGSAANHVAKFTVGSSTWAALGTGVAGGFPLAVTVGPSSIVVGGSFTTAGGGAALRVAQFTGDPGTGSWSALGSGADATVRALGVFAGVIVAGGDFTVIGGVGATGYAHFLGAWSGATGLVGVGASPASVAAVAPGTASVFVGGQFAATGSGSVQNIASYDGTFDPLGTSPAQGLNAEVFAVARSGSGIIATGDFLDAGGTAAARIARWNGSSWTALGSGLNGTGRSLAVNGNDVYVGGSFTTAGGVSASGVALWNGSGWSALGAGPGFSVSAVAVDGNIVYAGGNNGGNPTVARWSGGAWTTIGVGVGSPFPFGVITMVVAGGELYVGGEFTDFGGSGANNVVKWTGSTWVAVATTMTAPTGFGFEGVHAIVVSGGDIFIGGAFASVDGVSAHNIARKNGSTWSALGAGIRRQGDNLPSVNALAISGSHLFAGGMFSTAGGNPAASAAVWDGSTWSALDTGVHAPLGEFTPDAIEEEFAIRSMAISGGSLFVGGDLVEAGGAASMHFGRWEFDDLGPDLLCNGDFSAGLTCWFTHEPGVIVHNSAASGVFEYYRASSGQAVVFTESGDAVGAGVALLARFDIGNSSNVRKRISVLILNSPSFDDLSVCTFWLPANSPLRTYEMRTHTTKAWSNAGIYFYAATVGENGGRYLVDNVSLHVDNAGSDARTDCVDPLTPVAPGGANSANLINNGDFSAPITPPSPGTNWTTFGNGVFQISGGVFEYYRVPPTDPAAVVIQTTLDAMPANTILTAQLQLGNSSSVRKRVTILLHDESFADLTACTFWLPPGQALSGYTMRTYNSQAWSNATISIYAATIGTENWIRIDNVSYQTTPSSGTVGTECIEPGGGSILSPLTQGFATVPQTKPPVPTAPPDRPGAARNSDATSQRRIADPGLPTLGDDADMDAADGDWIASGGFTRRRDADVNGTGVGWQAVAAPGIAETLEWSRAVDLTTVSAAALQFSSWLQATASGAVVQVSVDGLTWDSVANVAPSDSWAPALVDLAAYAGHRVRVRFVFAAPPRGADADVWRLDEIRIRR